MRTYVVGNKEDFTLWCQVNGVQSFEVGHIPDYYNARGVSPLPGEVRFVVLGSADLAAVATLKSMGYDVGFPKPESSERDKSTEAWKVKLDQWVKNQVTRADMKRFHWKRFFELLRKDRKAALHHRTLANSIKLDSPHPLK